jgi:hypothetical protein
MNEFAEKARGKLMPDDASFEEKVKPNCVKDETETASFAK